MVKLEEVKLLINKFSQMKALIRKIKRIDSLGTIIQVEHPITRKKIDLPIPSDERQKTVDKLMAIKGEIVTLIQSIDWNVIE